MKHKKLLLCLSVTCMIAVLGLLSGCNGKGDGVLPSPDGLKIDNYMLSWNKVDGAEEYLLSVNGYEFYVKENKIDAFTLLVNDENEIKVMALGDLKQTFDSDWSDTFEYSIDIAPFYYRDTIDDTVCEIAGVNSEEIAGKLIVPNEIDGKTVKVIKSAFKDCEKLTDVIFLGEETEIGASAFSGCVNLKRVILPKWMSEIPASLFRGCSNLSSIEIPEDVTIIESSAFQNCTALENLILPNQLTKLGNTVFGGCASLKQILLPESLQEIDNTAFIASALESIRIPKNVQKISASAFAVCNNLKTITVDEANIVYKSDGNCIIRKSDDTLIAGCVASTIPKGVRTIGDLAFWGVPIEKITIPESVTKIKSYAFASNDSLIEIEIPEGVTIIEPYAFSGCDSLSVLKIPSTVTNIQLPQGVRNCTIDIDKNNPVYKSDGNCIIRKSDDTLIIGTNKSVIPSYVKTIGDSAFQGTKIEKILIPSSVEVIESAAFSGCTELKSITFSEGLVKIGSCAFYNCGTLDQVVIPKTVKEIGDGAFSECIAIFIVPDSVETIGNDAFGGREKVDLQTWLPPSMIFTSAQSVVKDGWSKYQDMGLYNKSPWYGYSQYICACDFGSDDNVPYVKSFVLRNNNTETGVYTTVVYKLGKIYAPVRAGYKFIGWATDESGENILSYATSVTRSDGVEVVVAISNEERNSISDGTVLYAVWEKED